MGVIVIKKRSFCKGISLKIFEVTVQKHGDKNSYKTKKKSTKKIFSVVAHFKTHRDSPESLISTSPLGKIRC